MAKINGKKLQGVVGPVRLRFSKGKQLVESKPKHIKQTVDTKKCAATFCSSANFSRTIMDQFATLLNKFQDNNMYNRLQKVVSMVFDGARNRTDGQYQFTEDSFELLNGFNFNINSPFLETLRVIPKWCLHDKTLRIRLSALNIPAQLKFPLDAAACRITFYTLLFSVYDGLKVCVPEEKSIVIQHDQHLSYPEEFSFNVPDGCLCIVGCFLEFYRMSRDFKILLNSKDFNPSSICASVMAPGEFKVNADRLFGPVPGFKL
jgi:hypothetical protein